MDKVPVSVIIPAKNEKNNIVPVINALKDWADEIYVVDSQSTDGMPDVVAELAKGADLYSVIRTMTHTQFGHESAAYLMQTGRLPGGGRVRKADPSGHPCAAGTYDG